MPIVTDPERMRAFAADLQTFGQHVTGALQNVHSALSQLASAVEDPAIPDFMAAVKKASASLTKLMSESAKTSGKLRSHAELLEQAQKERL